MSHRESTIERYESYTQADPKNPSLWLRFGDVLHEAGQFDRAEQAFRTSLELDPESTVGWSRVAAVQISRGHFEEAEGTLRRLLAEGERDTALAFNLGLVLYFQRRFSQALEILEPLARVARHSTEASYYVLSCLHNLHRDDEAIERGEGFLKQFPAPKVRGYLALVYLDAGRMPEACEHARQVLSEQPENTDAAAVLATHAIESQQIDEAEDHLRRLTTQEPNNVRGWQGLALTALYRKQAEQAIGHLQRAMTSDPENIGNFITLGWVHITRYDFQTAEKVFRDGIAVDRNDAELHGGLATALAFQHRLDDARQEIALALGLQKQCFGALFARSILLRLSGKEEKATQMVANLLTTRVRPDGVSLMEGLVEFWKRHPPERKP